MEPQMILRFFVIYVYDIEAQFLSDSYKSYGDVDTAAWWTVASVIAKWHCNMHKSYLIRISTVPCPGTRQINTSRSLEYFLRFSNLTLRIIIFLNLFSELSFLFDLFILRHSLHNSGRKFLALELKILGCARGMGQP